MVDIEIDSWWKATEIPLIETDWRNIRIYCDQEVNPFKWKRCLYLVRLSPPFSIVYGDECQLNSPLVYVGQGNIESRWSNHRNWLLELGHAIPGGRYEVWVCQPRCRNNRVLYKDIEADILVQFKAKSDGFLPLRNQRIEGTPRKHEYAKGFFDDVIKSDRRYLWGIYPIRGAVESWYFR
jgi:hypothetical protein